ncbi:MAG TPA: helix-turn-helix transcriptional regulator [Aestuariivirgaceae bacterium]|jgi:DNA-binding CsgD family transcriptional regulator|nr:helix-turn-helix transcriptional regulator [Aestuariivirgaceae bacterium]
MAPVLGEPSDRRITEALARAIAGIGSDQHVERMVDLIRELVPQDLVTVTRYSTTQRPEFVSHRNFSDAMVKRYLEIYYLHDPFFDFWRRHRRPGVVPLKSLAGRDVKRGRYVAEFLAQSVICDEVGVLLDDGPGWCLGIFLDRSEKVFSSAEIARLEGQFPVFAALHGLDTKSRRPGFMRTDQPPAIAGRVDDSLPERLWPELSSRERQLVGLILAGYPTALIAKRLGISVGTVKNHRRSIYRKLDITTERELFLRYFEAERQ